MSSTAIDRIGQEMSERLWREDRIRFRSSAILFLCGKVDSSARRTVLAAIDQKPYRISAFLADKVWTAVPNFIEHDALRLEVLLAEICDSVLLFPESPGSWAELGAFSVLDSIGAKTLAPKDISYFLDDSFLNNGPYVWLKRISNFYDNPDHNWECDFEDEEDVRQTLGPYLVKLERAGRTWYTADSIEQNSRVMFLVFLYFLFIIGPVKLPALVKLMAIANRGNKITTKVTIYAKLAVALNIAVEEGGEYRIAELASGRFDVEIERLGPWSRWRSLYLSYIKATL